MCVCRLEWSRLERDVNAFASDPIRWQEICTGENARTSNCVCVLLSATEGCRAAAGKKFWKNCFHHFLLFTLILFIYFKKASILTKLHEKMVCLLFGMCFSCRQTLLRNTASHYSLMKKEKHNIRSWSALLLPLMCG